MNKPNTIPHSKRILRRCSYFRFWQIIANFPHLKSIQLNEYQLLFILFNKYQELIKISFDNIKVYETKEESSWLGLQSTTQPTHWFIWFKVCERFTTCLTEPVSISLLLPRLWWVNQCLEFYVSTTTFPTGNLQSREDINRKLTLKWCKKNIFLYWGVSVRMINDE